MADVTELRMNVAALKRVDPYVKEILETATHVALYTFNSEINEWERTDVEGALFVYSRSGEPFHGILIMNRLNTNNLLEPVIPGLELQLQEPFLLYRNTRARIYGIWFYDKDECIKIASMLDKLVRHTNLQRKNMDRTVKTRSNGCGGADVNIFSMLNKAQEDYNSNKVFGENKSSDGLPRLLKRDDAPPQSVMDFFAKASSTASHFAAEKATPQLPGIYVDPKQHTSLLPEPGSNDQLKPFLKRLMSNPAHSVEHIEMKQRSVTPHAETSRSKASQLTDDVKSNGLNIRPLSSGDVADIANESVAIPFVSQTTKVFPAQQNTKVSIESNMSFLRISSPVSTAPQLSTLFGSSSQTGVSNATIADSSTCDQRPLSAPLCCCVETPSKPALMPPTMFTSSAAKSSHGSEINHEDSHTSSLLPAISSVVEENCIAPKVEPLTKNQLIQALNYLIKNDPEFVNKLHEAYVKSIADMVR